MRNLQRANEFAAQKRKRSVWRNVVTCIAAVVVFCTTYALILPAITMEKENFTCGLQAHTHTSECYQLVCGKQENFSHTHTKPDCYDAAGKLTCTYKEQTLHHHTPDCYSKPQPACGQTEHPAHTHEDGCYTEGTLTCTLAETPGHTHTAECYPADFQAALICGQQDIPEHRHTSDCYRRTCELEEHTHTDACVGSHEAFLENLDDLSPTEEETIPQPTEETAVPEATEATEPEAPTEVEQPAAAPTDPTEEPTEPTAEAPGDTPDDVPALMAVRSTGPQKLTDVAQNIAVASKPTEYDPTTGCYKVKLDIDFKLRTALTKDGTRVVTNGQKDADGNPVDCGLSYTMCLGELGVEDDILAPAVHDLYDGSKKAATYTLTKGEDGKVYLNIEMLPEYVAGAGDLIDADMQLSGEVNKDKVDENGDLRLPMEGDVTLVVKAEDITYPDGYSKDGYMKVDKKGAYSSDNKTLTYEVTVSTNDKGTPGKIQIEDTMQITGVDVEGLESVLVDGKPLPEGQYTFVNDNGKLSISLKDLDGLNSWGSRKIEYVYRLKDALPQGTQVANTVKASSEPDGGGTKLEVTKTVTTTTYDDDDPSSPFAPKLAKRNGWDDKLLSDENPMIPWTVIVNDNKQKLDGKVMEDLMLWQCDKTRGLKVLVDGQEVTDFSQYFDVDYTTGKVTFKADSDNHQFTLTYYTPAPDNFGEWGRHEVTNTAKLGEKITTSSTAESNQGNVAKENTGIDTDDQGRIVMDWKVTITLARDGMPLNQSIMDFTKPHYIDGNGDHFYDKSSVKLFYHGIELTSDYYETKFYQNNQNKTETENCSIMEIILRKDPSNGNLTGNDQLVVTYRTYTLPGSTVTSFDNKVTYRGKDGWAKVERKPDSIRKLGNGGQAGTTEIKNFNGELDWTIVATVGTLTKTPYLDITDVLPEHVNVLGISARVYLPGNKQESVDLTVAADGTVSGTVDGYVFSGTCVKEGENNYYTLKLRAVSATDGAELIPESTFEYKLKCKVDDDYLESADTGSLTNVAEGGMKDVHLDSVSQTQDWEKEVIKPESNNLAKNGEWNNNSQMLNYTVQINPEAKDLQPGSTRLYVTDEFTYDPLYSSAELVYELVQGSVKLYEAVDDGSGELVKGNAITDWRWTADEDNPGPEFSNSKVTKFLRLDVPDATALILEYSYKLVQHKEGVKNFNLSASNRIYLNTTPDEGKEDNKLTWPWKDASAGGSMTTGRGLAITKVEEGNSSKTIPNTHFQVYRYNTETGDWEAAPMTLKDENGQPFTDYVTDQDGELLLQYEHGFAKNVLYKLVETQSADGYILAQPAPSVKFYFQDTTVTTPKLPDGYLLQDALDLSEFSASQTISNKPNNAEFGVSKLWRYEDGTAVPDPPAVTLKLMRIITEQQQDTLVNDPLASTATVTVKVGKYNGDSGTQTLKVTKGSKVTITVNASDMTSPWVGIYLPGQGAWQAKSVQPTSSSSGTCTYEFTAKYNVVVEIHTNANAEPSFTCTYSGQSSGGESGSADVLEVKEVGTITLSEANGWRWHSSEQPSWVPVRGTYEKDGKTIDVWYSYYVVETSGNYDVRYTNSADGKNFEGVTSGNITVSNTLPKPTPTSLHVEKKWEGLDNLENSEVRFKLIRKQWDTRQEALAATGEHPTVRYDMTAEEIAQLESGTLALIGDYTLTADGGWQWSSTSDQNLTLYSEYNGKYYTYFVVEEPGDFQTAYSSELSSGTITVTNTITQRPTDIEVDKKWFSFWGDDMTASRTGSVSFDLYRVATPEGGAAQAAEKIGTFSVSQTGNWTWSSKNEPLLPDGLLKEEYKALAEGEPKVKVTYTYYIQELVDENATEKYTVDYENNDGISQGTITMKNTLESPKFEFPQTGGPGTRTYALAGAVLCLMAVTGLACKRRRGAK